MYSEYIVVIILLLVGSWFSFLLVIKFIIGGILVFIFMMFMAFVFY